MLNVYNIELLNECVGGREEFVCIYMYGNVSACIFGYSKCPRGRVCIFMCVCTYGCIHLLECVSYVLLRTCVVCLCTCVHYVRVSTGVFGSNIIMPACVSKLAVSYWSACVCVQPWVYESACVCMLVHYMCMHVCTVAIGVCQGERA